MTVNTKIESYEPWKLYYEKKDVLDSTHSLVEVDGPDALYNMAIEIPNEQVGPVMNLMYKEIDARNRFSLTDGQIQGEFEIWDGDYEKHLYFCVDFKLNQAIKFSKQAFPTLGYIPVGKPCITIGAQKIFTIEDLKELIRIKQRVDARIDKPTIWKVG